VIVEIISVAVMLWVFFGLRLIRCPTYADGPITIFQYLIFLLQSLSAPI